MHGSVGTRVAFPVRVQRYGSSRPATRTNHGYRLQSEWQWVVEGRHELLQQITNELPSTNWKWAGKNALVLSFVNSGGTVELPHLGTVELVTGKFGEDEFDAMLGELTESATTLPFSAGETGAGRYAVSTAPQDEVLYHAFVYLRYILSERAPEEVRLLPALELVMREPHRLWRTDRRDVRIEALTRLDAHTPLDLVTRTGTAVATSSLSTSAGRLASRLGGRLPEVVSERRIRSTTDTPENRFVKAFVTQSRTIIGRMRSAVGSLRRDAFRINLLRDCDRMESSLMPIARHSIWEGVGRMVRIPFASTVLQRRRGYRRVLQHFSRIRLAPAIPVDQEALQDMLELKNTALLYELWTFFRLVEEITKLKGAPLRSGGLTGDHFRIDFAGGGTFEWASGVRLAYNQPFSRSRAGQRHSYSVLLRPDIALSIPHGLNAGLHLFDAKFRVHPLTPVGLSGSNKDGNGKKDEERTGSFKRSDIYKMHAYRDAIPDARSVWILYPGGEFRFFGTPNSGALSGQPIVPSAATLPEDLQGVGAIPLAPVVGEKKGRNQQVNTKVDSLGQTLQQLLGIGS